MFNVVIDQLLKLLLGNFLKPETIKDLVARLESLAIDAVKALFAMLLAWLLSVLNGSPEPTPVPNPDLGFIASMAAVQEPVRVVGSASILFMIASFIIRVLPFFFGFRAKASAVVLLVLSLSPVGFATDIDGPSSVPLGRLVCLSAKIEDGSGTAWLVFPEDVADYREVGKELIMTGPPGRYSVHLFEFRKDVNPPLSKVRKTVEIQAGPTPIPPEPNPTPPTPTPPTPVPPTPIPPTPVPVPTPLPAGRFDLANFAYRSAASMPLEYRAKSQSIASDFRSFGSALAAGGIATPNDLLTKTRDTLNAGGMQWQAFRSLLSAELKRQTFNSRPKQDFVDAWAEIATGLEAVR